MGGVSVLLLVSCVLIGWEGLEVALACLVLMDLLFQGLPLPFGCGMAVLLDEEGETKAEVEDWMLVTAGDGACSVIAGGCEVKPSEESVGKKKKTVVKLVNNNYPLTLALSGPDFWTFPV